MHATRHSGVVGSRAFLTIFYLFLLWPMIVRCSTNLRGESTKGVHMSTPNLDVRDVARLARINLTDDEAATFQSQLGKVLEYVEQLGRLDVSLVEPTAHANPVFNVFRADATAPGLGRAAVLANAPHSANNLVVVTKVIENP